MSRRHQQRQQVNETQQLFQINDILREIRHAPEGLSASELADLLDFNRTQQKSLAQLLARLQSIGLLRRNGDEYRWTTQQRALLGTIRQRRRKLIHFIPDDSAARKLGKFRIAPEDLGGAFDSDRVIVSVGRLTEKDAHGERAAKVEMLIQRGPLRIVGRVHHGFRTAWVESLEERFPHEIDLPNSDVKTLAEGSIVIVEITSYPGHHRTPQGRVIDVLGNSSDEPGMDINIVIHKHDLPHIFPDEVLQESETAAPVVTTEQCAGRRDFRQVPVVTIDGETARDFDDAISLEKLANGNYALGVHIADVSYYVRPGTALDHEAQARGTSVYFPERAIPMLPERLSNGICSLNPNVDRLTMSALLEVDEQGQVVSYELCESVIRSAARMTYTKVNQLLQGEAESATQAEYAALTPLFKTMEQLAHVLIKMRNRRGAIDFNLPEAVFNFDDEGRIAGISKADRNIAHRLIEEFMLLANETVAGHFARLAVPAVYRIHEDPEPQRVIEFAELAHAYGYGFPFSEVSSHDYQRLSEQLSGKVEEKVLAYAMLRSLQRARYAAGIEQIIGHFGLASAAYTHFTSPIRRYPDLLVHRLLRALLQRGPQTSATPAAKSKAPIPFVELETLALDASERERNADAAENELDDWRKAKFMAEHVGEEFDGTIINVRDFGFYVELDEFFIEGMVPINSLIDDFYRYDERIHALVGRAGKRYKLGDRVRIRVERVNVDRHLVDFAVVGLARGKGHRQRR